MKKISKKVTDAVATLNRLLEVANLTGGIPPLGYKHRIRSAQKVIEEAGYRARIVNHRWALFPAFKVA